MFDMREIGKKISRLRKEKDMTQVELADALNISYQAVSNWERGDSMPDIAKLSDISKIFDISIDDLLGNVKESKAVLEVIETNKIDPKKMDVDDLDSVLPLMKPTQIEKSMEDIHEVDPSLFKAIVPFLGEDAVDKLALKIFGTNSNFDIYEIVPFMSEEGILDLVKKLFNIDGEYKTSWLVEVIPFMNEKDVDHIGVQIYEKNGVEDFSLLVPFVSEDLVEQIVLKEMERGNKTGIINLLPFAGKRIEESILKDFMKQFNK